MAVFVEFSMKSVRRATGRLALRPVESVMPSKFVTPSVPGVPGNVCTPAVADALKKKVGSPVIFSVFCVKGVAGVAVKRDQRRVTVSAVAIAMIEGVAAVKVVTWTATV